MNANVRNVAWAIAEAWWRKQHRVAAGFVPEAESATDYADRFWEGWAEEAHAALWRSSPQRSISVMLASQQGLRLMCCSAPLEAPAASYKTS